MVSWLIGHLLEWLVGLLVSWLIDFSQVISSEQSRWEVVSEQLESLAKKTTASVGDVEVRHTHTPLLS